MYDWLQNEQSIVEHFQHLDAIAPDTSDLLAGDRLDPERAAFQERYMQERYAAEQYLENQGRTLIEDDEGLKKIVDLQQFEQEHDEGGEHMSLEPDERWHTVDRVDLAMIWIEEARRYLEVHGGDFSHTDSIRRTIYALGHTVSAQDFANGLYRLYGSRL